MMPRVNRLYNGFTLIELLVVITIIVVLLALLTPALDKAIYQAELAVCGTRLKTIATGVSVYAAGNKRWYPYRSGTDSVAKWHPESLAEAGHDDRPTLTQYMGVDNMLDPLAGEVELDQTSTGGSIVFGNYAMWFGFGFWGHGKMNKLGDRFEWGGQRYNLVASDYDDFAVNGGRSFSNHPDVEDGITSFYKLQNQPDPLTLFLPFTWSRWELRGNHQRGRLDLQWIYSDGAVVRINQLAWDDPDDQMDIIPIFVDATGYEQNDFTAHVPKQ